MADGGGEGSSRSARSSGREGSEDGEREEGRRRRNDDNDRPSTSSGDRRLDPRLDFLSPSFDARLALSTPGLRPPDARAPVLDNVSACRRLLPPGAEGAFETVRPPPQPQRRKQQEQQQQQPSHPKPKRVPALDAIAEASTSADGPLSLLKRAYETKSRVGVVTRHASGVRGTAVGRLCGFDVFMNLILRDVVEDYTVRVPVVRERPPRGGEVHGGGGGDDDDDAAEEKKDQARRRLRHCYRLEARRRTLRLVFLRGDSVVLVSGDK